MSDTAKFWPQLKVQMRRALAPRLLVFWLLASLSTTLLVALPLSGILRDVLDLSAYAGVLAQRLDLDALTAIYQAYQQSEMAIQTNVTLAWVCTLLFAPMLAAMAAAVYRAPNKLHWSALLTKGAADYGRWFLLHLSAFITYLFGFGIAAMVAISAQLRIEHYTDANSFARLHLFSTLLAALIAVATHFIVEITRAEYVLDSGLRMPPEALIRALSRGGFLRRIAGYSLICGIGIGVLLLLLLLRQRFTGISFAAMLGTLFLSQFSVVVLAWMRTARLFVLASLLDQPLNGHGLGDQNTQEQTPIAKSFARKPYHSPT